MAFIARCHTEGARRSVSKAARHERARSDFSPQFIGPSFQEIPPICITSSDRRRGRPSSHSHSRKRADESALLAGRMKHSSQLPAGSESLSEGRRGSTGSIRTRPASSAADSGWEGFDRNGNWNPDEARPLTDRRGRSRRKRSSAPDRGGRGMHVSLHLKTRSDHSNLPHNGGFFR